MHKKINIYLLQFVLLYCQPNFGKPLRSQNLLIADFNSYSFVVAAVIRDNRYPVEENVFCTGALISRTHVLMCEHCFDTIPENFGFKIIAGSGNLYRGTSRYPYWSITYNHWAESLGVQIETDVNDIAITKLLKNVREEWVTASISVRFPMDSLFGLSAKIPGWGDDVNGTACSILKVGNVTVISHQECRLRTGMIRGYAIDIPSTFICSIAFPFMLLGDGDSGGPLLYQNNIIALNVGTCPRDEPGSFTSQKVNLHIHIEYYRPFIENILNF